MSIKHNEGSRKKVPILVARPLIGGGAGWGKGLTTKNIF